LRWLASRVRRWPAARLRCLQPAGNRHEWKAEVAVPELSDREQRIKEAFNSQGTNHLASAMGIKIVEASAERVVATMPVHGNTQPYGILHGGASCVLAETIGSLGAALQAGPGRITVGIEINATHHRAVSSGLVTAVATLAHGGRTLATYDVAISDEQGRRICTARLSCLHREAVPGGGRPVGL
jgi:1,4-dihydroxy-2-naphthoyl-CoA hydrolase